MNFEFFEEKNFKDTELGPLPEDWEVVRLGEVAKLKQGRTPKRDEYSDICGYRIIKVKDFTDGGFINIKASGERSFVKYDLGEMYTLQSGDSLILSAGHSSEVVGQKIGFFACEEKNIPKIFFVAELIRIRTNKNVLNPYFCFVYLNLDNVKGVLKELVKGVHLYPKDLESLLIPLPPLSEQKAIAEVLSTIQEARERTEEVIKATKELKKSMMKHLFTYGPVSLDEIDKVKLKETEIGLLPEHWEVVKLGDLTNNNLQPKEEQLAKIRSLKSLKYIPFIPMSLIPEDLTYINKWELKLKEEIRSGIPIFEGDLLLAKITPCFENGKQGIIKGLPDGIGYATTEVIPLRLKKNMVSTEYLSYYLRFPPIRSYLTSKMEGTTGRKRLPKSQLENLSIPLPPLSEQQTISNILQAIDEKIQREEERKKALENLFKSMLHNLMSGKIRVKNSGG